MLWNYWHHSDGCCISLHMENKTQYRSKLSSYVEKEVEASFITVLDPGPHIKGKCLCLKSPHCGSLPATKQFMENNSQCSDQSVSHKSGYSSSLRMPCAPGSLQSKILFDSVAHQYYNEVRQESRQPMIQKS